MKFQDTYDTDTRMFRVKRWDDDGELITDELVTMDQFLVYNAQRSIALMYKIDPDHDKHCEHFG